MATNITTPTAAATRTSHFDGLRTQRVHSNATTPIQQINAAPTSRTSGASIALTVNIDANNPAKIRTRIKTTRCIGIPPIACFLT
ncbi:hypothetical protein [Noviluteimonas gilva]|uniref:Uncharacterized protein n=1 Tax=Noviluteimonas gilva TaxID=2682097 RepID=A0A7C9HMI9_9GAMM|nr:hypothetical protein [Lysobacter gilvus]MUV14532.1 hypothetical protein [Lysobacter gilvus]